MRVLDLLLALVFGAAAAVQFNDPDPILWVIFYGAAALLAAAAAFGRLNLPAALVVGTAALAGLVFTAPGLIEFLTTPDAGSLTQEMSAARPYVEQSREFIGLLMGFGAAVFYAVRARKRKRVAEG